MTSSEKRTFSLPTEHSAYIDQLVESGSYASASEVVRAGLRALQAQTAAVDQWLLKEVAQTFDSMRNHPESALTSAEVSRQLRARHAERTRDIS